MYNLVMKSPLDSPWYFTLLQLIPCPQDLQSEQNLGNLSLTEQRDYWSPSTVGNYFIEWISPLLAQNFSVLQTLHNLFTTGFYILASKSALHSVPSPQEHFRATFSPCGSRPPTRPPRIPASWCSSSCQCYPLMRRSLSVQQIEYGKK